MRNVKPDVSLKYKKIQKYFSILFKVNSMYLIMRVKEKKLEKQGQKAIIFSPSGTTISCI